MGAPKALLHTDDGLSWLDRAVRSLREGGCAPVAVVLGASFEQAVRLVPDGDLDVVRAERWERGMGESLRAGLQHLAGTPAPAVVVTLVDLPDVGPPVVSRVLHAWGRQGRREGALVRAVYDGRPGHPVLIGREHWDALIETLAGDVGAQSYLARVDVRRKVETVECADLATGSDVDAPPRGEP